MLLVLAGGGCATLSPDSALGPSRADWDRLLRSRGIEPEGLPHPLEVNEAIRAEAERLAGHGRARDRLKRLQSALFDSDLFPFEYETEGTLTAAEAFDQRRGNCLSFTNLFIAMARSQDIDVQGAFPIYRGRSEREGDLVVVNTHVVAAYQYVRDIEVYDFDQARLGPNRPVRLIDDAMLAALYLNNRGVEHLRRGNVGEARRYMQAAVDLAPAFAGAWGNLGVARRRSGDSEGALEAYRRALEIAPRHPTILTNLASLFRQRGQDREAENALAAVDLSLAPSHVLIVQGDLARTAGRVEEALGLYRRAHRRARSHPDPFVAIARAEWELGRRDQARRALERALERDPEHREALELEEQWAGQS